MARGRLEVPEGIRFHSCMVVRAEEKRGVVSWLKEVGANSTVEVVGPEKGAMEEEGGSDDEAECFEDESPEMQEAILKAVSDLTGMKETAVRAGLVVPEKGADVFSPGAAGKY